MYPFPLARRALLAGALVAAVTVPAAAQTDVVRLDYAYYNPVSLILKDKGWLEQALAADGIGVEWTLSLGSNKALEYLSGGSIDFGSTAGAAALLGRANGNPIKAVYVYSRPEWTALVTRPDTGIAEVADLEGKRIAVTRGTDPHIFLLRALAAADLRERDVETVPLQHPDGRLALVRGDVDAWAGLDPYMAQAELQDGAKLFFRDPALNTYGFLNVREAFAAENPALVGVVLGAYERARRHAVAHPDETARALAAAAKLDPTVAERQLGRTDLGDPVIGETHVRTIVAAGEALTASGVVPSTTDVEEVARDLVDPSFARRLAGR